MQDETPFVVIMEDDLDLAGQWSAALRSSGFDVEITTTASAALEAVDRRPPDLVIADIFVRSSSTGELVPDGGIRLVGSLQARAMLQPRLQGMRVIAVSGAPPLGHIDILAEADVLGAHETLQKPFAPDALVELANRLLGDS